MALSEWRVERSGTGVSGTPWVAGVEGRGREVDYSGRKEVETASATQAGPELTSGREGSSL